MTPRERFFAAVEGRPVDHVPVTTWVHFLSDHLPGEETASLHERFLKSYAWDLAKVMGDYRYPVPAALRSLDDAALLDQFEVVGLDAPCFAEQLKCLKALRAAMGPDFPLVETGFDPYQSILRNIGRDQEANLWKYRAPTLRALERACESIRAYVRAIKKLGVEGYFYSVNSAIPAGFPRGASQAMYETFLRPFDLRILKEAEGMVRILHVHGTGLTWRGSRTTPAK